MKSILRTIQTLVFFLLLLFGTNTEAQVTCTGGTANIPLGGSVVINGVNISTSYTGDVTVYSMGWTSCSGTLTSSANSLLVGHNSPSNWSLTLNFDKPVNDLIVALLGTGNNSLPYNEDFIFNSNGGTVSITAGNNCYTTISGNTINSGYGAYFGPVGTGGGGGGLFKITAPNAYTRLVINGSGGLDGSLLALCESSIKPACTAGTTAPPVSSLNYSCPSTSVNLATAHTGTIPSGASLVWYKNNTHTGTVLTASEIANAGAGTYYSFYYDSVNNCYSQASNAVIVTNLTTLESDGDGVSDACDLDDDNDGIKDLVENCSGFLAQNTSGAWKGKTTSNLTATLTGANAQPIAYSLQDDQIHYYVNRNGGEARYSKFGNISFTYTFSTPVPAREIAFSINDLDPSLGSSSAIINFIVNGGSPNENFISTNYGSVNYLNFNTTTGKITPAGTNDDQQIIIKGIGDLLVSTITVTSIGIGIPNDQLQYTLFANNPCDTDKDGIEDYLDLDSDGDGCPDAIEGGGTFTTTNLETSTMSGGNSGAGYIGTSTSPITQNLGNSVGNTAITMGIPGIAGVGQGIGESKDSSKNDCTDTDGDGVSDWQDIDDDNDGILDAEESPNCFFTVYEANRVASVTSPLNGAETDPVAGVDIPLLYNDNTNDGAVSIAYNFASSQTITSGSTIFIVKYPTPIAIKSLSVAQAANGMASSGYAKLYGSTDGINYTLLTAGNGISIASTTVNFNNTSTTEYLYYQIRYIGTSTSGNTTSVTAGTAAIHEIYSLAASTRPAYNPSAHPKPMICNFDTDGDTIPNHLDTDSDGDGCSDAYEGSATTNKTVSVISGPYGANGLADSLETSSESGMVNYVSTYRKYAAKLSQKLCLDTDNDGVPNPIDLDDDNDGVLDTTEGDFCGKLDRNIRVGYLNVGAANIMPNRKKA